MITASTDIQYLKGVGAKRAVTLKNRGIDTVGALLRYFPRAYLDWQDVKKIDDCDFNNSCCIKCRIISPIKTHIIRKGMTIYSFKITDDTAVIEVTLFNQKYLAEKLCVGREYLFYGKLDGNMFANKMTSPIIMEGDYNGVQPIYRVAADITSKQIEKLVKTALTSVEISESLPSEIIKRNNLCGLSDALWNIHFPKTEKALEEAKRRLVFEELFILQAGLTFLKRKSRGNSGCRITESYFDGFKSLLPFSLTNAQIKVVNECLSDMSSGVPMNRLVQGDVGSGKTAVCAALAHTVALCGYQAALMAPTEVLANQHYATLSAFFSNTDIKCGVLTGSMTKKQKTVVKDMLLSGEIDIVVGTHALLTDDVEFNNLGLVITDEQHRFGVAQRGKLSSKGQNPNTLVMSATPIPRTLGLIIYGDLDISIIDEYPKGRQKIHTYLVDSSYKQRIFEYIKKALNEGRQAYFVCPLVEENEAIEINSATEIFEELSKGAFIGYTVGLLHGKMSAKEKDRVMASFSNGETQLLVSTTVIEVGIDVPNAVIMVIENAERFGLSQLHQLRGRIGRGKYRSDCILISDSQSNETKQRLKLLKTLQTDLRLPMPT